MPVKRTSNQQIPPTHLSSLVPHWSLHNNRALPHLPCSTFGSVVRKEKQNEHMFHKELFIAGNSLFFTRLRGDRGDHHGRAPDHLCHLPVSAGRVSNLSPSLTTSSQLVSALTARFTRERSGRPITASCATLSLSQRAVLQTNVCGTNA